MGTKGKSHSSRSKKVKKSIWKRIRWGWVTGTGIPALIIVLFFAYWFSTPQYLRPGLKHFPTLTVKLF